MYPCKTTNTAEVIKHLTNYFSSYSKPLQIMIISDRGSAFTSKQFTEFLKSNEISHSLIATGVPRANGQMERYNRFIIPMIAKLTESPDRWDCIISDVECAVNNTVNKSTGQTPSKLLFQKSVVLDTLFPQ